MTTKAHAKYGGSNADRYLNCPGSVALTDGIPPEPDSPAGIEGTRAHEVLELLLKNPGRELSAAALACKSYGTEMVAHAEEALKKIKKLTPKGVPLRAEVKIKLGHIHEDMGGTADVVASELFGELHVIDYKYGTHQVKADNNAQLAFYGVGVAHQIDWNFANAVLTIIQPRGTVKGAVRSWRAPIETLEKWDRKFKRAVDLAESKKGRKMFTEGRWCFFCPARGLCPKKEDRKLDAAREAFAE